MDATARYLQELHDALLAAHETIALLTDQLAAMSSKYQ